MTRKSAVAAIQSTAASLTEQPVSAPFRPHHRNQHETRKQHAQRTLRQHPCGRGCGRQQQPGARLPPRRRVADGDDPRPGGQRHEKREREVRQRLARHREVAKARRDDGAGEQPRALAVPPRGARTRQEREPEARERGRQARRPGADTGDLICQCRQPVVQDGLLKSILVVVVRGDPVTALHHLARGFGVEGLVGIGDGRPSQAREERQERQQDEKRDGTPHAYSLPAARRCDAVADRMALNRKRSVPSVCARCCGRKPNRMTRPVPTVASTSADLPAILSGPISSPLSRRSVSA